MKARAEGAAEGAGRAGMRGTAEDSGPGGGPAEVLWEKAACLLCGSRSSAPCLASRVQLAPATDEVFRFDRCDECGLVYLGSRPTEASIGRYYPPAYLPHRGPEAWGRWAHLVERSERRLDEARVRRVLRHASERRGPGVHRGTSGRRGTPVPDPMVGPVLDLGCGRPTFLQALHVRTGARCVGLDLSNAGWRDEPDRWAHLHLLRGVLPDAEGSLAERLDGRGDTGFRVITLWHALEHDYRPIETLRSLHRLAAPGALLIVEVPDFASLTARLHGPRWAGLHTPRHTAAYTPGTLRRMVEAGGWRVERHLRHGSLDPYLLWWLGRRIRRGDALDGSLEARFPGFVAGKAGWLPLTLLQRWIPLGVQTVVARRE